LIGFCDNDWHRYVDDMKSTLGYGFFFFLFFFYFYLGLGAFTWCLKKNQLVAGLSTEVEYVAIGLGTQQVIWL